MNINCIKELKMFQNTFDDKTDLKKLTNLERLEISMEEMLN